MGCSRELNQLIRETSRPIREARSLAPARCLKGWVRLSRPSSFQATMIAPVTLTPARSFLRCVKGRARVWPKWARFALRQHPVASRRGAPGTGRACPRDRPPRDGGVPRRPHRRRSARRHAAGCSPVSQQAEEPSQVLSEPGGMSHPHHVDRVDPEALAARQPTQQPLP
jgi:hypothetical protein